MIEFKNEAELAAVFQAHLINGADNTNYIVLKECDLGYCRPDFVAFTAKRDSCKTRENEDWIVEAFELKLANWRQAVDQANTYLSFADTSYVVLPIQVALRVSNFPKHLGLIGVGGLSLEILQIPSRTQQWTWARSKVLSDQSVKRYSIFNLSNL